MVLNARLLNNAVDISSLNPSPHCRFVPVPIGKNDLVSSAFLGFLTTKCSMNCTEDFHWILVTYNRISVGFVTNLNEFSQMFFRL